MPVYVDPLMNFGWKLRGREIPNCHMFTDEIDLTALHELAAKIGMKRAWFQDKWSAPHYDLTPNRRADAIEAGEWSMWLDNGGEETWSSYQGDVPDQQYPFQQPDEDGSGCSFPSNSRGRCI